MKRRISALEKEVPTLVAILRKNNPDHFGPEWIQRTSHGVYSRIYRRLNGNGWNDLVACLPGRWRSRWHYQTQRKGLSLKQEARAVERLLKRKRPDYFSPYWIDQNDGALYARLKVKLPRENGKIEWKRLISLMRPEWQRLWMNTKPEQGSNTDHRLKTVVRDVTSLLERENPKSFGPKWLEERDIRLYQRARPLLRMKKRMLDWRILIDLLDPEWRTRWQRRRDAAGRPLEFETTNLKILLETSSPDYFSASWIRLHDDALYRRLRRCLKIANDSPGWNLVLEHLGDPWRSRWRWYGRPIGWRLDRIEKNDGAPRTRTWNAQVLCCRGRRRTTLEGCVQELENVIEQQKPNPLGPVWIQRHVPSLCGRLRYWIRNEAGKPDWSRVVGILREPYRGLWRQRKSLERCFPATTYRNEEEVRTVIQKHANKLYTFITATNDKDMAHRDTICRELIRLARRGNADAEERLIELVSPLIDHWSMTEKHLSSLSGGNEMAMDKLRRCIYFFQEEGRAQFLRYLWKSLFFVAQKLKTISLDAPVRGCEKNVTVLDTIGRFDSGEFWRHRGDMGEWGEGGDVFA